MKVDEERVRELYEAGKSIGTIARTLGSSYMAIRFIFIKRGWITRRTEKTK